MTALNIWMNGELVGTWTVRAGTHTLRYAESWLQSPRRRSLSLSLPITAELSITGDAVHNYFDNLLPDNARIRDRLRRRFRVAGSDAIDLLEAIGRECVGAVQLLPPGIEPEGVNELHMEPLDAADVERHLDAMLGASAMGAIDEVDEFRISIAGAQEKTALLLRDGRWYLPRGTTPTTHILKLPLGMVGNMQADMSDSVENEWLCLKLLSRMGLPAAECEMAVFGDRKVLVVERFDRMWMDDGRWVARAPQEDFCQATGAPPHRKYESDGGPGMDSCLRLLAGSQDAAHDRGVFLLAQLAFWMLAATDGHAKNFSLFLHAGDEYTMTPLYDVLSAWPIMGPGRNLLPRQRMKLAMAVRGKNAHYRLDEIQPRHWTEFDQRRGTEIGPVMGQMAELVPRAIADVEATLPNDFPVQVWEAITANLRLQAELFLRGTARFQAGTDRL